MTDASQPPRLVYAAWMTLCILLGVGAAYAIGSRGTANSANFAALAVAIAGVVGYLPAVLRLSGGMQTWGLLVFGASIVRMLAVLSVALFFTQMQAIAKQPYWLGVVSGSVLILVLETAAAFVIIHRHEAARVRSAA